MHGFPLHWHELVEVCLVESGTIAVFVDGQRHELEAGELVVIGPQCIHGYEGLGSSRRVILLQFSLDLVTLPADARSDTAESTAPFAGFCIVRPRIAGTEERPGQRPEERPGTEETPPLVPSARLVACIRELEAEFSDRKPGYRAAVRARLLDCAVLLLRASSYTPDLRRSVRDGAATRRRHDVLERVLRYIQDNAEQPISLETVAGIASMSRSHFSRFFHRETGRTFQQYLARTRVTRAEQLLYQTDLPVQEISYRSGFTSSSTFNRLFRRYTGRNPRSYRSD